MKKCVISMKYSALANLDTSKVLTKDVAYLYNKGFWLMSSNSFYNGMCMISFDNKSRIIVSCDGEVLGIYTKVKHIFKK